MEHPIDDGGPAFPQTHETRYGESGMSLRDWFAGQALIGYSKLEGPAFDDAARWAYEQADAMLRARKGGRA